MAVITGNNSYFGANIGRWMGRIITLLAPPVIVDLKSHAITQVDLSSNATIQIELSSYI